MKKYQLYHIGTPPKPVNRLIILQKKALRIMNFKDNFFTDNILKFGGEITLEIFSLSINSLIEKYLPYFMIALNFQEICIDMKLACLLMTISTYPKVLPLQYNSQYYLFMELYTRSPNKTFITQKRNSKKDKIRPFKIFNCKPTQVFNRISTNFN